MPYRDNRFWDPKKGWVRPPKNNRTKWGRIIVERKIPKLEVDNETYEQAPINPNWVKDPLNPKHDYKMGYTKKTSPQGKTIQWLKKVKRFETINFFLSLIPWIKVKEVKEETRGRSPFTRRD